MTVKLTLPCASDNVYHDSEFDFNLYSDSIMTVIWTSTCTSDNVYDDSEFDFNLYFR